MSADVPKVATDDDELDPDEPRTPLWLPLAGLALFVVAGLWFLLGEQGPNPAPAETAAEAVEAAAGDAGSR